MKRYILITNIWGRKADKIYGWNYKDPTRNSIVCDEERVEFDTVDEARTHIELFEENCGTFDKARRRDHFKWLEKHYDSNYIFETPTQRAWGWLLADRETMNWVWGGEKLYEYDNRTNKLILKDMLFRGPDEIPKNYKWDDGEYEGWLQYRWGDRKNAVGYVEKNTPKNTTHNNEPLEDDYEDWEDSVEDEYIRKETKELEKKLEDRW